MSGWTAAFVKGSTLSHEGRQGKHARKFFSCNKINQLWGYRLFLMTLLGLLGDYIEWTGTNSGPVMKTCNAPWPVERSLKRWKPLCKATSKR